MSTFFTKKLENGRPSQNTGRHGPNASPAYLENIILASFGTFFENWGCDRYTQWLPEAPKSPQITKNTFLKRTPAPHPPGRPKAAQRRSREANRPQKGCQNHQKETQRELNGSQNHQKSHIIHPLQPTTHQHINQSTNPPINQ